MSELEKKRKMVEIARVTTAKGEIELKIMELQEQIQKLEDSAKISDVKIKELQDALDAM